MQNKRLSRGKQYQTKSNLEFNDHHHHRSNSSTTTPPSYRYLKISHADQSEAWLASHESPLGQTKEF